MLDRTKEVKQKTAWLARVVAHPITVSAYYGSAMVVALVYSSFQSEFDGAVFAASAFAVATVLLASIVTCALFFRIGRQEEFEDRIADMKEFINAQHMGWIVNDKYIRALEFGSSETWVFTRKLANDLDTKGEIFQAVKSNLASNLTYVYFVPDAPSSFDSIEKYHRLHKFRPGQVKFYLIPESQFTFYTEVVVYNVNSNERLGIEWLPQSALNYYIAMDRDHTDYLVGIGRMYVAKFVAHASPVNAS